MSLVLLLSLVLSATPVKVARVDESGKDASFAAFKKDLEAVVKKKDAALMRALLDPKAQAGFGESGGLNEFLEALPLDPASPLWPTLTQVLSKGCARVPAKEFVCPALFAKAPDDVDWFEHSVLMKDVAIRATPAALAKVLATRSDEIVKGVRGPEPWVKVETADGVVGHVKASELESPIDVRAFFKKGPKGWRLTFLGAGD
jgi:hypothetical protein